MGFGFTTLMNRDEFLQEFVKTLCVNLVYILNIVYIHKLFSFITNSLYHKLFVMKLLQNMFESHKIDMDFSFLQYFVLISTFNTNYMLQAI